MTPEPLDRLDWTWRGHKSALWWLWLLYRRPSNFQGVLRVLPKRGQLLVALKLYAHFLPYTLALIGIGQWIVFERLGVPKAYGGWPHNPVLFHLTVSTLGIALGIAFGIVFGIASGIALGIVFGIASGIAFGIALGTALGITSGIALGIAFGIVLAMAFGIASGIESEIESGISLGIKSGIASGIPLGIALGIASGISLGIALGIAVAAAVTTVFLRLYYLPYHLCFVWPTPLARRYRWHPASWDDLCRVPFPGFHRLLVAFAEREPVAARREIERLIDSYPSQRGAALRARTILVAREAGRVTDLTTLESILAQLPEGAKGYLADVPKARELVHGIVEEGRRLSAADRPVLRSIHAGLLSQKIRDFRDQIAGFGEPLSTELREAAQGWLRVAESLLPRGRLLIAHQVFRAGDPVDRKEEAFVHREKVIGDVDRQLTLSTGCPGLVLYGRRRTGKSTVLRNLEGFLPDSVVPVFVSLQNPEAFTSLEDLLNIVTNGVMRALPQAHRSDAGVSDLPGWMRRLSEANRILEGARRRVLLTLDEYENIDRKIGEKVFPVDLLDAVRESIQSHRSLIWLFAGSHEITELPNANWTSYLVSARTVEMPLFTLEETRILLTEPLRHSPVWSRDDRARPSFRAEFWGDHGVERIQDETGGWPHLVQLIAERVVDRVNDEQKPGADVALLNRAIGDAVVSGHNVLHQLYWGECSTDGEREYLAGFRTRDVQPMPSDDRVFRSLRRRLIIVEEGGACRLRVPLMLRWLRERG